MGLLCPRGSLIPAYLLSQPRVPPHSTNILLTAQVIILKYPLSCPPYLSNPQIFTDYLLCASTEGVPGTRTRDRGCLDSYSWR